MNNPISVIEFTSGSFISQIYRGNRTVNMIHHIKETIINPKIYMKENKVKYTKTLKTSKTLA